jgi:chromate reductase, NAD(P)H dehydrogenase (quinone)
MYKVAVIVGSNRKDSINRKLALALAGLAGPNLRLKLVGADGLPVYNPDFDSDMPAEARALKAEIETADAVLFVTPEYNRSIPTALKNVIDWASRPYGKSSWAGKPVAIAGASAGNVGSAVAQQHLRTILGHLDAAILGQPEVFFTFKPGLIDEGNRVTDETTRQFLRGFLDRFDAWIGLIHRVEARAAA